MSIFQWGIIGPGSIANKFAEALVKSERGTLTAIASRSPERAQEFAQRFGVKQIYSQYSELMADPNIDIIYIATPHSHHFQLAKQCLEAGKNILLEKPLTINAAQTRLLIELAQDKGVLFQEALWSRFMPGFAKLKSLLQEGKIGKLQYIQSDIGFAFGPKPEHRLNNPLLAGGALLDLGVYSISLSQFLLEQVPDTIQAISHIGESGIDETTQVNMHYPDGQLSQFSCSIKAQCSNSMTLVGDKGRIHLPEHFWVGEQVQLWLDGKLVEKLNFPHQVNGFEHQIEESMSCIEQGKLCSDLMPHKDSLAVMRVMDEIRRQIGLRYGDELEAH
ncbi:Gfo/Idh/MocA family protein [Paraglaciecola hydrolytica]|uniref:Oxidoreductase n=1 Tax=Paraglaciecola hydrolytica TaxID=1799789 RepID=A0A148KLX4_9ALTE|nr:Gfo/Idh/MocA family oxidoreductase [Paraglaciecola hydrolytica]KXI27290.1 oxidoreductase [Paraglaciecola hydrolytica]